MIVRSVIAGCLLLIAGCAQHNLIQSADYQQQRATLLSYPDWQMRGKIGLKLDGKPTSAMLNWQQTGSDYAIRLSGPLGTGAVRIERSGGEVRLLQAGEPPMRADSADQLLQQVTGLTAPLDNIRFWVRGLAADAQLRQLRIDPQSGLPASFEQDGWQLSFDRYRQHSEFLLPGRIILQPAGDREPGGDKIVTILVSRWTIPSSAEPAS